MAQPNKRSLAVIVGATAAAALLVFTPSKEGTILGTYKDMGGVLTYCTGATENAQWGKSYTLAECRAQLDSDLARHAEGVGKCVALSKLTDGQRVAFVDAAYNIGVANFCRSSMAFNVNLGNLRGACDSLMLWNRVQGNVVRGLTLRRAAEREMCLKGIV